MSEGKRIFCDVKPADDYLGSSGDGDGDEDVLCGAGWMERDEEDKMADRRR